MGRTREDVLTKRLPCAQGGFVFSRSELRAFFYDRVLCQAVCAQEHVGSNFFWPCPVVGRAPFI